MADSDDEIYIDVVPRLDEGAADEVEHKLRDKLSHTGDSLKDVLSGTLDSVSDKFQGLGDKLKNVFSHDIPKELESATDKIGDDVGEKIGSSIGNKVGSALEKASIGDKLNSAMEKAFGDPEKFASKLTDQIKKLGELGGSAGKLLGGEGSGSDFDNLLQGAKSLGISGPLPGIQLGKKLLDKTNENPGKAEDWLSSHIPGIGGAEDWIENKPREAGRQLSNWFTGRDASSPTRDAASDKWSSSVASAIDIDANTATISAGSVSLGGNISLPSSMTSGAGPSSGPGKTTSSGIAAAGGDSGGMSSLYSGGGGTTIGKGHSAGGVLPGDSPGHDNMIGVLPSGSMVSLEGGEGVIRPEAMGRPGVSDLVSQLNRHYDEGTASPAGVGGADANNPTLAEPPTQGNEAGNTAGGNAPKQQQQLGKGQGGGVSGGGLIGAAEQAAVAAATVGGFGAGGIAAQMAVQETNLAIQKTSQMAAAVATAPFETFGLGGGMMGAPTVNPMGGWIGKLIAGQLGQQNSLPNIAGASTQPPKKPEQKPEDQQEGQGESVSKGPDGSKDDPMHVNVTNQPQAPQGSATSAMNVSPAMAMAP